MCGIFGVHGNSEPVHLAQLGLYSLQHRGQESVGVAVFDKESGARVVRSMGTISPSMAAELDSLHGQMAVGHTRYSTAGSSTIENAQPVFVRSRGGYIALAHNGNITNAGELRQELEAQGSIFASTMDSEVLVHRLAKSTAATPDGRVYGGSVDRARRALGRRLAQEHPAPNADLVFSVPDSSNSAALGYAEESSLPFEFALIRNHYVGRTFIQPTQKDRDAKVKV